MSADEINPAIRLRFVVLAQLIGVLVIGIALVGMLVAFEFQNIPFGYGFTAIGIAAAWFSWKQKQKGDQIQEVLG